MKNRQINPAILRSQILKENILKDFAIESSINGIAFSDLEGRITYVNEACLKMWGGDSREEIIGLRADFFTQDPEQALNLIEEILHNRSWEGEILGKRKDNTPIYIHVSAFLVHDDQGEPLCMMCSFIDVTERKKIEEELKFKELAIESSINAIGMSDLEGRVTYVNEACFKLWGGKDRSEMVGKTADFFAQDPAEAFAIMEKIIANGFWEGDVWGKKNDGTPTCVHMSAFLVKDGQGKPVGLMSSFIDITERKKMEEELKVKEFAIESSINGIAFSDLEGRVTYVNKACLKMWGGQERSEMIGLNADFFSKDQELTLKLIDEVTSKGSWQGEIWGKKKNGEFAYLYVSAFLVKNDQDTPLGIMCSFTDITAEKQKEEELRIKDFAIESSINAVALGDLQGNITYANQAFVEMWGGEKKDILGESIIKFARHKKEALDIISQVLDKGRWFGEIAGHKKDGSLVYIQLSASLVTDSHGQPLCLYCSFVNITKRKEYEFALNRAKEKLEDKVAERTKALSQANEQLKAEIEERLAIEKQLRQKETELKEQARHLQEINTAMKVLLKRREDDRLELEDKVLANVKDLIMPYIEDLKNTNLSPKQESFLKIIESNIENIVSPFAKRLSSHYLNLTPTQIKVAEMIKSGKNTKEIAELMNITDRAVEFHRNSIREKLGLKHKKVNLRSYLLSMG